MPGVFLSYRRAESDYAVLMYAWLAERFGPAQVFWDREDIEPGKDFREVLSTHLDGCQALVALIGPNWSPSPWIQNEIGAALKRKVLVLPVLVGDTPNLSEDALPPPIRTQPDWSPSIPSTKPLSIGPVMMPFSFGFRRKTRRRILLGLTLAGLLAAPQFEKSGKLRVLGHTGAHRLSSWPDMPTIAEGIPGFELVGWFALFATGGTPADIITRLNTETVRALQLPDIRKRITETLHRMADVDAHHISVALDGSVVTLEGDVSSWSERDAAAVAAAIAPGVTRVENNLRIKPHSA